MTGKLIFLSGPSFGAKTYLSSKLINDFDFKVIQFEKHIDKANIKEKYKSFYTNIQWELIEGNNVLAEAVYNSENNPFLKAKFNNPLIIVCLPSYEQHYKNYKRFLSLFGSSITNKRTGGASIEYLRKNFLQYGYKKGNLIYNGTNYQEVKQKVKEFLEKGD